MCKINGGDVGTTRDRLIAAAGLEFNERGFMRTDTNRIARAAGFAPQTFYRHFEDKIDVFIAVYEAWVGEEWLALRKALDLGANQPPRNQAKRAAEILVDHHSRWAVFRRSLRWLTVENEAVRAARADSRRAQAAALRKISGHRRRSEPSAFAAILSVEALCDAYADAIVTDLGIARNDWLAQIIERIEELLDPGGPPVLPNDHG